MNTNTDANHMMLADDYQEAAEAENTRIAHAKDLARFLAWGGVIPSTPEQVSAYVSEHAGSHKAATIARWLCSISVEHKRKGFASPTTSVDVKKTVRGVKRIHGAKQRRVSPLCTEEVMAIVDSLKDTVADARNRALVLVGFSGAMRGSEALGLTVESFKFESRGMDVDLGSTKTDAAGEDSVVTMPMAANSKYCPVWAIKNWLQVSGITEGPVFRSVNRHDQVGKEALTIQGMEKIIKALASRVGLDASDFSSHSLRAGLVTSAVRADKPLHKILEVTRHVRVESLGPYIRDAEKYENNASALF